MGTTPTPDAERVAPVIDIEPGTRRTGRDVFVNVLSKAVAEVLSEHHDEETTARHLEALKAQKQAPKSEFTTEIQYAVYLKSAVFTAENYTDEEIAMIVLDLAYDRAVEALQVIEIDGIPIFAAQEGEESGRRGPWVL